MNCSCVARVNEPLVCPFVELDVHSSFLFLDLRGYLHDTGTRFIPVRVHPGSHLYSSSAFVYMILVRYRYETFVPV